MGIRIRGDENDRSPLAGLRDSLNQIGRSTRNLASGRRINEAGDDAAGLVIAENLRARVRSSEVAQRNLQAGVSLAQTAEGGLQNIQGGVARIRELAVQATNGALTDQDRAAIQTEINDIRTQVNQVAEQTQFNGRALLNGATGGGNAAQVTAGVTGQTANIDIADTRSAALGLDTIDVTTQAGAQAAITTADQAANEVSQTRAQVGATRNVLQRIGNRLQTAATNEAAAESIIRNADFAQETTRRAAALIRNQFAVALSTQQNQNRGSVLRLLNG